MSTVKEPAKVEPRRQPPYNVVLLDDDFHTTEYVVVLCKNIFGYPKERALKIAEELSKEKRSILWTGPLEVAELKRDQIHGMGKDPVVKDCKGSMSAELEPVS